MAEITTDAGLLETVKGRVAVIIGGANGIGAATVTRLFRAGAHVFNADLAEEDGRELVNELQRTSGPKDGDVTFMRVDVTDYQAVLSLFDTAYKVHGRVDIAIYSSGITEVPGLLTSDQVDLNTIKE
ncbi:hypothetical protein CLAIMM_08554, partial [Cladophialophora immunda]